MLGSQGPWQYWLCRSAGGYHHRRYGAIRAFSSLWQLCPVRTECEGGVAVLVVGTLVVPSVQGHGLPQPQELWPSV